MLSVVVSSYELMQEMATMPEYDIKFSHEALTYPRTFGKELGENIIIIIIIHNV